jgi:hypothetical protein
VFLNKLCYIVLVLLVFFIPQARASSQDWQVRNSRHFIIYHRDVPVDYLNQLITKAENYYKSITNNLGFKRFDFWSWDNRCRMFLYPDRRSYLAATGSISWSRAHVYAAEKHIITYANQEGFFETILPHEMAHIIFREFIGFDKQLPIWLDEGVAILAEADSSQRLSFAKDMIADGQHIPLSELSDIRNYKSIEPYAFYSQAASIVDFLLNRYGRNNFVVFCRELRDRDNWQEALRRAYRFNSLSELEQQWLEYEGGKT